MVLPAAGGRRWGWAAVKGFLFAISCCYKSSQAAQPSAAPRQGGDQFPAAYSRAPASPGLCLALSWPNGDVQCDSGQCAHTGLLALLPLSIGEPWDTGNLSMFIPDCGSHRLPRVPALPVVPSTANIPFSLVLIWFWFELS